MHSSILLAVSGLAALASAQTFTACNPTKNSTCPNNPAIAQTFETNFKNGKDAVKGWKQTAGSLDYSADGALFTIKQRGDAPTIQTEGYLHFGYIEVVCKAASGQGIISSIVVQSEDLDEVDWEFRGGFNDKVQMNFFGKGDTTTYDRMIEGDVSNTLTTHKYALNWTSDQLVWIIDDKPVRTLKYADSLAHGGTRYPQTPSNVRIGIWAGGDDKNNEKGVVEWAGGVTDFSKAPFTMSVESVKIINYNPGKEYHYKDMSGDFKSIEVIEPGNKEGSPVNSAVISSAPAPTGTAGAGAGIGTQINVPSGSAGAVGGDSKPTAGDSKPTGGDSKPTGGDSKPTGGANGGNGGTVYLTSVYTVTSCGATVTNCPAKVHTTIVPHTTGSNGEKTPCSEGTPSTPTPVVPGKPSASSAKPSGPAHSGPAPSGPAPSSPASSKVPVPSQPPYPTSPASSALPIPASSKSPAPPAGSGVCTGGVITVTVTSGQVPSPTPAPPAGTPPPVIVSSPSPKTSAAPSSIKTVPSILPPSPTTTPIAVPSNGTVSATPSQFTGAAAAMATGVSGGVLGGLVGLVGVLVL